MPIVNLGLTSFYTAAHTGRTGQDHYSLARYLAKSLRRAATVLDDRGYYFEAEAGLDLAKEFDRFSNDEGTADDFSSLWEELENWSTTSLSANGRNDVVAKLPVLDPRYAF